MKYINLKSLWPAVAMSLLFVTAVMFRPLLPIDETRYMSVAWEMWLRHDLFAPLTMNFELYHHKPPMLFWFINAAWSVFGVSRWAGALPVALAALACVYLTKALAEKLFKAESSKFENLPFIMIGSVPFLIYGTLIMFDITLSMFVLSALLCLILYAEQRRVIFILALALALGLGVLTKGPVAWLYVIFPVLLAPLWASEKQGWVSWYGGCALAFILSLIPVALWLIPVLKASNPDFAIHLLWQQTAGRVTGKMGSAHHRPIYFYLPLLPVLFLPWAFFPSFWAGLRGIGASIKDQSGLRFLLCWVIPVIIAFSLIGGKQPHYLVPLLPGILIFSAYRMKMDLKRVMQISVAMVALIIAGQAIALQRTFEKYNLQPIADYIHEHESYDWAFARKYQGEFTFLGRLEKSIDVEEIGSIHLWLNDHPHGMAIIRYETAEDVSSYQMLMTMPYRGKNMGVFTSAER